MVSKAQIAYPTNDEETSDDEHDDIGQDEHPIGACEDEGVDERDELDELDEIVTEDSPCMESVPPDRCFDISPEEFCGDPYEQEGHIASRQELGRKGEEAAVRYLKSRHYTIIKRNWFCRFGEADIIARDPDGTLCFIEVKTRQSIETGLPEEAITRSKQSRYERIALCYMMVTDDWDDNESVRFDAIAICVTAPHRAMLRHHRGCFNECF